MIGRQEWGGNKADSVRGDWLSWLRGREERRIGRGFVGVERKSAAGAVESRVKRKEERLYLWRLSAGERCRKLLEGAPGSSGPAAWEKVVNV